MGCSHSKHESYTNQPPVRQVKIPGSKGGSIAVIPSIQTSSSQPVLPESSGLTRQQILEAFRHMAEYLDEQGVEANMVTIDGAIDTLYLRSRETAHNVDFFLDDPASKDYTPLKNAANFADSRVQGRLGQDWLSNSAQLFMPRDVQTHLVRDAFVQNEVIFEQTTSRGGLRVYAAPWSYAICEKLDRLGDINPQHHDMDDAVLYLRRYLDLMGQYCIKAETIRAWARWYHKDASEGVLKNLNVSFNKKFEWSPIEWN